MPRRKGRQSSEWRFHWAFRKEMQDLLYEHLGAPPKPGTQWSRMGPFETLESAQGKVLFRVRDVWFRYQYPEQITLRNTDKADDETWPVFTSDAAWLFTVFADETTDKVLSYYLLELSYLREWAEARAYLDKNPWDTRRFRPPFVAINIDHFPPEAIRLASPDVVAPRRIQLF